MSDLLSYIMQQLQGRGNAMPPVQQTGDDEQRPQVPISMPYAPVDPSTTDIAGGMQGAGRAPAAPVPMPQPRPQMAAPVAPAPSPASVGGGQAPSPMGFFQRNAAMMTDPVTGGFIDPQAAQRAQQGLIPKMMGYLNQKADSTVGAGIPGASGPTSVGGAPLQSAQYPGANAGILPRLLWHLNGNG